MISGWRTKKVVSPPESCSTAAFSPGEVRRAAARLARDAIIAGNRIIRVVCVSIPSVVHKLPKPGSRPHREPGDGAKTRGDAMKFPLLMLALKAQRIRDGLERRGIIEGDE